MTGLSFDILGKDKASPAFEKVGRASDQVERKFGFLAARSHGLTAGMTAGFGKIVAAMGAVATVSVFKDFINEARESRKVGALTEAVIKSTGGVAKISAKQVGDLATAISNKTGADDEAVQSGENLLLTFTNVKNSVGKGNDIFNQATQTIVDMTAALNGGQVSQEGVKASSIQLGKALNDPIKGVTALQKVGVSFTQSQKDQIKTLVESGDTLGAQKIILKELGKEFGGAAAAASDPLQKLSTIVGNVKEAIGTALLPIVDKAATWLGENLPGAVSTAGKFFETKLLPPLKAVSTFITDKVIPVASGIVSTFSGLGGKIIAAVGKIDVGKISGDLWSGASKWAGQLITGWKSGLEKGDWAPLGKAIGEGITSAVQNIGEGTGKLLDAVGALIDKVDWAKLGGKISNGFLGLIHSVDWDKLGGAIGDAFITALQKAKDLSTKLTDAVKSFVQAVDWQKVGHDSTDAIGRFASGIDWGKLGKDAAKLMATGLKVNLWEIPNLITGTLTDVAFGIWDSLNSAMTDAQFWLHDVGADLISGLWSGITDALTGAKKWLEENLVTPIHDWVRDLFGIHSPSTMFASIGAELIAGLKVGIVNGIAGIGKWIARTIISPVLEPFSKAGTWLVQHGKNMVAGFKNGVVNIATGIGRWVYGNVISPVAAPFVKAGTWLVQAGKNAVAGFKNGVVNIATGIGKWIYNQAISPLVAPFTNKKNGSSVWLVQAGKNVIAGFKNGMVSIWNDVTKWVGGIATWIKNNKGPVSLDGRLLIPAGQAIMSGFLKGLKSGAGPAWSFVQKVGGKTVDMLRSALGGIDTAIGSVPNATGMAKLVQTIANSFAGWGSGYQWNALYKLIMGESGFRSNAQNPTSTAYGIGQFLDSTWATVGGHKTSDPALQAIYMMRYIKQNYGSPAQAYAAWSSRSPHWYKQGTPWVPDDQLAYLHKGEAVIPAAVNKKRISMPNPMVRLLSRLHGLHEAHQAHVTHQAHASHVSHVNNQRGRQLPRLAPVNTQPAELTLSVAPSADSAVAQLVHKLVRSGTIQLSVGGKPVRVTA